jgi:cell division protein FtsI/penicillin-binding protein 2
MLGRTDSRNRLLILLVVFIVAALALVGRLAYWQILNREMLETKALAQTTITVEEPTRRGEIYDRSGTVVLATTVARDRLVASTRDYTPDQRRRTGDELIRILELDVDTGNALRERLASGKGYVILARELEPKTSDRIRAAAANGRVVGITLESEPLRIYPQAGGGPDSSLAAHLLGFVNREGSGQYGIEGEYQSTLAGSPRVIIAERDAHGRAIPETATVVDQGIPGQDLRTTIDAGLQLALEQEILAAWIADKAKSVSALVMDPYTGEVYAEATYPSYDANEYRSIAQEDPGRFIDPVVSNAYEPGSVFKMMTATAALEANTVKLSTRINDVGTLHLDKGRAKIDDADRRARGWMSFEDGIAFSRNVIAAKVALGLGDDTKSASAVLYDTWMKLGFGAKTGIDVAGESKGQVNDPGLRRWAQIDLANASFGQGVAVTPIQLATAYAALMNGGNLVQPHVVKAIGDKLVQPEARGAVISPSLSTELVGLMKHVITTVPTYKDRTMVPGYEVGGKTGTAQIWDNEKKQWKEDLFNYSFIGYIAREPGVPDLVVAVRIEEGTPTVRKVGQLEMPLMSFQLFRRIATDAITTTDLLTDRIPKPLTAER